ncbi:hypothetical protein BGC07_15070 [Piscirickettsia litoralis]|uniref:EF-hand domain-containing protein n=2 Tax=Piscirickettsia litoralis TaxID=1891921 RepID=A0ABX2ZY76_9GAMM|nr:hypothetical protein BGC07_15070 [Piscirickettsia litoralis]
MILYVLKNIEKLKALFSDNLLSDGYIKSIDCLKLLADLKTFDVNLELLTYDKLEKIIKDYKLFRDLSIALGNLDALNSNGEQTDKIPEEIKKFAEWAVLNPEDLELFMSTLPVDTEQSQDTLTKDGDGELNSSEILSELMDKGDLADGEDIPAIKQAILSRLDAAKKVNKVTGNDIYASIRYVGVLGTEVAGLLYDEMKEDDLKFLEKIVKENEESDFKADALIKMLGEFSPACLKAIFGSENKADNIKTLSNVRNNGHNGPKWAQDFEELCKPINDKENIGFNQLIDSALADYRNRAGDEKNFHKFTSDWCSTLECLVDGSSDHDIQEHLNLMKLFGHELINDSLNKIDINQLYQLYESVGNEENKEAIELLKVLIDTDLDRGVLDFFLSYMKESENKKKVINILKDQNKSLNKILEEFSELHKAVSDLLLLTGMTTSETLTKTLMTLLVDGHFEGDNLKNYKTFMSDLRSNNLSISEENHLEFLKLLRNHKGEEKIRLAAEILSKVNNVDENTLMQGINNPDKTKKYWNYLLRVIR